MKHVLSWLKRSSHSEHLLLSKSKSFGESEEKKKEAKGEGLVKVTTTKFSEQDYKVSLLQINEKGVKLVDNDQGKLYAYKDDYLKQSICHLWWPETDAITGDEARDRLHPKQSCIWGEKAKTLWEKKVRNIKSLEGKSFMRK